MPLYVNDEWEEINLKLDFSKNKVKCICIEKERYEELINLEQQLINSENQRKMLADKVEELEKENEQLKKSCDSYYVDLENVLIENKQLKNRIEEYEESETVGGRSNY